MKKILTAVLLALGVVAAHATTYDVPFKSKNTIPPTGYAYDTTFGYDPATHSLKVQSITVTTLTGYNTVPSTRTVNGYPLSANITLGKSDVGLGNVDNTSDANKPISTSQRTQFTAVSASTAAVAVSTAAIWTQLNQVATDTTTLAAGISSGYVPVTRTVNGHALSSNVTVTKSDVGLSNVDNTSDVNKPISTAQQTQFTAVAASTNTTATTLSSIATSTTTLGTSTTTLRTDVDAKVVANGAITGATKTKITYDTKGLVTSGADATTADIADSSNKRYVTDSELATLVAGVEPSSVDLLAIAALSSTGIIVHTGAGSVAARTIVAGSTYTTVNNGSGVSGNPTIDVAGLVKTTDINSVAKLEALIGSDVRIDTESIPLTRTVNGHALSSNVSVTASDVGLGSVENTALSTWAGSTNLTTLGTVVTGSIPTTLLTGAVTDAQVPDNITINAAAIANGSLGSSVLASSTSANSNRVAFTRNTGITLVPTAAGYEVDLSTPADMQKSDNLSGLANTSTARTNLGVAINTDVAPATSGSAILKGNGSGGFSNATAGTDYTSEILLGVSSGAVNMGAHDLQNVTTTYSFVINTGTVTFDNGFQMWTTTYTRITTGFNFENNTSTLTIPGMAFTMGSGQTYWVRAALYFGTSVSTLAGRFAFDVPSGASLYGNINGDSTALGTPRSDIWDTDNSVVNFEFGKFTDSRHCVMFDGFVKTTATQGGLVQLKCARNSTGTGGGTLDFKTGCWIWATRIPN